MLADVSVGHGWPYERFSGLPETFLQAPQQYVRGAFIPWVLTPPPRPRTFGLLEPYYSVPASFPSWLTPAPPDQVLAPTTAYQDILPPIGSYYPGIANKLL